MRAGIIAGAHIALFSDNRPRWLISDLAVTGIGAVDVPRGSDTATSEFVFILEHSGCTAAILQDGKLCDRLIKQPAFDKLSFVVLLDNSEKSASEDGPRIYRYQDILQMGQGYESDFETAAHNVKPRRQPQSFIPAERPDLQKA